MTEKKRFQPGNDVTFNTNKFNNDGFYKGTIYIVEEIIGNTSVTLKGYDDYIIGNMHLEPIKEAE